jgi:dienelactone hydrolase
MFNRYAGHFSLLITAVFLICNPMSGLNHIDYPKGQIIDHLICQIDPDQGYSVYLPSSYSAQQSWPIIYAFDPGAQGRNAVEKFQAAAEMYGYIVVGSNNAQNGPWEPIIKAAAAMWTDTHVRFSLDEKRIYSAGFSGGARAAALFSNMIGLRTAGVIGCGAGIAEGQKPDELSTYAYCGIAGQKDSNYREMLFLRESLSGASLAHRFLFFEGGHEWPPEEECMRALEWMEIQAMRQNLKARDFSVIESAYRKEVELGQSLEGKNPWLALSFYDEILNTYSDLLDTGELRETRERLAQSKSYKSSLAKEEKIRAEEGKTFLRFNRIYHQIEEETLKRKDFSLILREVELNRLKREAAGSKDVDRRLMASRILFACWMDCRHRGRQFLTDKRTGPAILFLKLSLEVCEYIPRNPKYLYYNLACAYALEKNAKQAVKYIESAKAQGFDEFHLLEEDRDFDPIRKSAEFKAMIKSVKKDSL